MDAAPADLTPVEQVSLLALRLRAMDARSADPLLGDAAAVEVAGALGLDLDRPKIPRSAVLVHTVRARMLDAVVTGFVAEHPDAVVLDLGCGLDTRWRRCAPPATVDWYDVDRPAVLALRERVVPAGTQLVAADVTEPGWLDGLPRERPALALTDGLMALLTGAEFIGLARAVTAHFATGELAFNAYSRLAMRNSRRVRTSSAMSIPTAGEGIDDPREAEGWGAGLALLEERFQADAPEVARWPPLWRAAARITARSTRMARTADRVLRYRFGDDV